MTITLSISIDVDENSDLESNTVFTEFVNVLQKAQSVNLPVRLNFQREPTFVPVQISETTYYQALLRMIKK